MISFAWKFKYFLLPTFLWWRLYVNYRSKIIFGNCLRTKCININNLFKIIYKNSVYKYHHVCGIWIKDVSSPVSTTTRVNVGGISTLKCWCLSLLYPLVPHTIVLRGLSFPRGVTSHILSSYCYGSFSGVSELAVGNFFHPIPTPEAGHSETGKLRERHTPSAPSTLPTPTAATFTTQLF